MLNEQLRQISAAACADLASLIASGEEDILKAIRKMQTEAELQESTPKFVLGFKIALDTDSGAFECSLNWVVRQSLSVSHQLEDPKQEKLGLDDQSGGKKRNRSK